MSDDLDGWGGAEFVLAADRLDTPDVVEAADPGDMLRQVASAAAQVRTALRSCAETDLSAFTADARPRAIVVAGIGGFGPGGRDAQRHGRAQQPGPGGGLPGRAAAGLGGRGQRGHRGVLLGQHPGDAGHRDRGGPARLPAGRRRRGGSPLHRIAEQARAPFVPVVPAGLPRSMLWAVAVPLLVIAERMGVARIGPDVYELAASRLEEVSHQCRPASESFVNPGKSLALDLVGALPMVWGTSALSGVAARRFASQLQENAKYPAICGVLPEAAHSQVAAFDGPFAPRSSRLSARQEPGAPPASPDDLADLPGWDLDYEETEQASGFTALRLILIADPDEDQRVAAQRAAVTELAGQRGVGISELGMDGEHPLVRLAGVIQLTDYASVYLAIASGIDPGQTVAIRDLRTRIE